MMRKNKLLSYLPILLAALFLLSGCGAAAGEQATGKHVLYDEPDKDALALLELAEGSLPYTVFPFSFTTDDSVRGLRLFCESYARGQKTGESVVLELTFSEAESAHPQQGRLLIDCWRGRAAYRLAYDETALTQADAEAAEPGSLPRWGEAAFPETLPILTSYRHALFSEVTDRKTSAASHESDTGEPIRLLLFGEPASEKNGLLSGKTGDDILSDEELLRAFDRCYVFYCVFE